MKRMVGVLLAISAVLPCGAFAAEHAGPKADTCPKDAGFIEGPFVPDAKTATAIFRNVEHAIYPGADLKRFPLIKAKDEGDYWTVFRTRGPIKQPADGRTFIVEWGGGQLSMRIDKCTGAVRQAAYMR
jgi:hypothetical protein